MFGQRFYLLGASAVVGAMLAGCASEPEPPMPRAFNLALTHPSPHANYIKVSPGAPGAELPPPQHIVTADFSRYLRKTTGCVWDASRRALVLGSKQVPAGYMVPISCP